MLQLSFHERGQGGRPSPLNHALFGFGNAQYGARDGLFGDGDYAADAALGDFEGKRANFWNSQTVSQGRLGRDFDGSARFQCGSHARAAARLDADDLGGGAQRFGYEAYASNQAAASHWHDNGVGFRTLLENLQAARSCASDDVRIVEAVDVPEQDVIKRQ
jgi:hypothetical protein